MRPITRHEIIPLQRPIQHFSDCYLVSTIGALARSKDGQKILSQNIAHRGNGFRIRFQNVDNHRLEYLVTQEDIQRLIPLDKYYNEAIIKYPQNPILKAIEVAMDKLLKEHPDKKPFVSKLTRCQERFEYNKPSNFMELFTGKKPIILNEGGLRMNLTHDKDKAIELLEKIDKADDFSFVAGTGLWEKDEFASVHCLTIEGVNTENRYMQVYESRYRESFEVPFDRAIRIFKFLTGYLR